MQPVVRAEKVQDPARIVRVAPHLGLRQLGVEPGRLPEPLRGDVVGVRIHAVWDEQDLRTDLADHFGRGHAVLDRVHEVPVRQGERDAPPDAQRPGGGFALGPPPLGRAHGGRLAVRQVEDRHPVPLLDERRDRPAHPDLHVVGVGADYEEFRHRLTSRSMIER